VDRGQAHQEEPKMEKKKTSPPLRINKHKTSSPPPRVRKTLKREDTINQTTPLKLTKINTFQPTPQT